MKYKKIAWILLLLYMVSLAACQSAPNDFVSSESAFSPHKTSFQWGSWESFHDRIEQAETQLSAEQKKELDALREEASSTYFGHYWFAEMVLLGLVDPNDRLDVATVRAIADESETYSDFMHAVDRFQPVPDIRGGSGVDLILYFLEGGDARTKHTLMLPGPVLLTEETLYQGNDPDVSAETFRFTEPQDSEERKAKLSEEQKAQLKNDLELQNTEYWFHAMKLLGATDDSERLTLESAQKIASRNQDFNHIWSELKKAQPYPDEVIVNEQTGECIVRFRMNEDEANHLEITFDPSAEQKIAVVLHTREDIFPER